MSETLRIELEPLNVRVITAICGSVDTPMFSKPGGPMELPDDSYYRGIEQAAWNERMDHQKQATNVDVLAGKLVRDTFGGTKGTLWHGAFSSLVWWTVCFNVTWLVDKLINSSRGVKQVKRM